MERYKIKTEQGWVKLSEALQSFPEEEQEIVKCFINNYDYNKCRGCKNWLVCSSLPIVPIHYPSV